MSTFKKPVLIAGSLLLVFSLIFLAGGSLTFAEENDFDELKTLNYKIEGTYEGKPAEFWHRLKYIGTEDEVFRMDITVLESEETMSIILDKGNDTVFIKQMGTESWQQMPMMFSQMWDKYREGAIGLSGSADDWRSRAEDDQDEYILEGEENGEEYSVKIYDIKVDEPIEDSVFSPDGS
ncbi:MAG: hypothetical protein ABEI54_02545 [Candidatus Bipolaricaulia bacterium]